MLGHYNNLRGGIYMMLMPIIYTFIVGLILLCVFILIIAFMIRRHKRGISACGCDCSECTECKDSMKKK
jgi:uncharacterized membrane protein